jgi:hypothetical protein
MEEVKKFTSLGFRFKVSLQLEQYNFRRMFYIGSNGKCVVQDVKICQQSIAESTAMQIIPYGSVRAI